MASANKETAGNDLLKGLKEDIKSINSAEEKNDKEEAKKSRFYNNKELKSIHMQLLIKPSTKERIKGAAEYYDRSMNDLICQILEEWLARNYKK